MGGPGIEAGTRDYGIGSRKAEWFGAQPQGERAEPRLDCGLAVIAAVVITVTVLAAAVISGEGVFIVRVMIAGACVASPIARFVAVEVVEGLFAAVGHRPSVAVAGIIAVIDMAVEVARAAEPVASADKHPVHKPIGPVVAVGCAVIGSVVEVAVGADRLRSEGDRDLGWRYARRAKKGGCENCESEGVNFGHDLSLVGFAWESAGELLFRGRVQSLRLSVKS
jgi:hypothetical protein